MQPSERATKKQQELLEFVSVFIKEHDYGPSYREIMAALGYKSVSTVAVHVDGLIAKGFLTRTDNSARSLAVANNVMQESSLIDNFTVKEIQSALEHLSDEKRLILFEALELLGYHDVATKFKKQYGSYET